MWMLFDLEYWTLPVDVGVAALFESAADVTVARVCLGVEAGTACDIVSGIPPGKVGLTIAPAGVSAMGGS